MSFFSKLDSDLHSTVAWLNKVLTDIEKKEPAIATVIDAGLKYVGLALQIALTATGEPAAATIVGEVVTQAQKDLAVVSATVTDFGPTPDAASAFTAVQSNLGALLSAGHVTNATSVAAVNKAVNEVGVIAGAVKAAAAALTPSTDALPTTTIIPGTAG